MIHVSPVTVATCMVVVLLGVFLVTQSAVVIAFVMSLGRVKRPASDESSLPRATVLLSVRGPDPSLAETLRNLMAQEYPDFNIHIVVDHPTDPTLPIIESVLEAADPGRVTVSFLREPKATCTLKCSSLIQAMGELEGTCEVVAFVDADARPHRRWLRDLVTPLGDPSIGATTGNRWYLPERPNWGSLVRYFWNAGSVLQMWLNGFVWAGSMALPLAVIRETGLAEAWSRALSVDNTVRQQLRKHGYRTAFVPTAILVNRESIRLPEYVTWVHRQMVGAKALKPGWGLIALHALTLLTVQLVCLILVVVAALSGDAAVAGVSLGGLAAFWSLSLVAAFLTDRAIRRAISSYEDTPRWCPWSTILKMVPAVILTYATYSYVFMKSVFARRVTWRGVRYEIRNMGDIRLSAYRPYARSDTGEVEESNSVI